MTLNSSPLGHGGHRDDRRRRLLAEDLTGGFTPAEPNTSGGSDRTAAAVAHKSANYGDAEFLETQLRLTDLIPRRLFSLILWLKVGFVAIAGLVTLYVISPDLLRTPDHRPAMAVLGGSGSLSNWFSSLLLLVASFLAVVNYTVRRHRTDDYHGRYRIWLWAAACWFLMSTDVAASLHQGLQQAMISLTGMRITGDGTIWWLAPAILGIGFIGARLLIDMWSSRVASTALILAAIAYLAALAAFYQALGMPSDLAEVLFLQGSLLAGHLLLTWSMALHARHVLLDAEGRLPRRAAKAKKPRAEKPKKKAADTVVDETAKSDRAVADDAADGDEDDAENDAEDDTSGRKWIAVHPPHGSLSGPALQRVNPSAQPAASPLGQKISAIVTSGSSSSSLQDDSKLSKADRKALKKKLLEERLKAEQRKASHW